MTTVKVIKSDPPESKEVLASAIASLGDAAKKLNANGINQRALIVLLFDYVSGKISKRDIKTILEAMPRLQAWYCK
jgi:hypothetical protein